MKTRYIDEIKAIIIMAAALILLASLVSFVPQDLSWYTSHPNVPTKNLIRVFGAYLAGSLFIVFGYSSYLIVFFLFFLSWNKFSSVELRFSFAKIVSFVVLLCVLSSLFSMIGSQISDLKFQRSGVTGFLIADSFLIPYFGRTGSYIILFTLGILSLVLIGEFLISPFLFKMSGALRDSVDTLKDKVQDGKERIFAQRERASSGSQEKLQDKLKEKIFKKPLVSLPKEKDAKAIPEPKPVFKQPSAPNIRVASTKEEQSVIKDQKPRVIGEYHLPPVDLLKDAPAVSSRKVQEDLAGGAKVLEQTLSEFGVAVRVADIERGPVITRYELEPAPGVKVQQITTLSDDIALAMKAQTVRIIAPIPGKNRVGIEVPNISTSMVFLKDVLAQSEFRTFGSKLTLALGKDTAGKSLIADLSTMPHLLIAGTTGAGKTVCVNSIIMSMLFNASPDEVKFLMIDPKMVELSIYNAIPHMLCPSVTDPKKVSAALGWVVSEMESRYSMLAKEGVRNIEGYNNKDTQKLPYIVVVIDELADLMQVASKQIEGAITRLAQLSRAVGIHLILATQRPSVDVITGVIKANFPARISFKVASKVDSRTVLDMNGADKLLGRGDMLFLKPGDAKPTRAQCCLVSDEEIQKVIDFIKAQQEPVYDDSILKQQTSGTSGMIHEKDELYDEAVKLVIETNQASTSLLQRRMRLGYGRAARLIDIMEQQGIVGPPSGSKPREILVNREEWLMGNMKKDG